MRKALLSAVALLALAACKASDPVVCDLPVYWPALSVSVQDSLSGANVLPGASVIGRSGAYSDSVVGPPDASTVGVDGPAGTYTLTVRQTGYQVWFKSGLEVRKVECGARPTVDVTARLKPVS